MNTPTQSTSGPSPDQTGTTTRYRVGAVAAAGLLALLGVLALVMVFGRDGKPSTAPVPATRTRTVLFEVTSSDDTVLSANLTMKTPAGGTSQQDRVALPLRRKDGTPMQFAVRPGEFVYISAQNNQGHGDITCTITVDGAVLQTATSSGAYVIASCSGTV